MDRRWRKTAGIKEIGGLEGGAAQMARTGGKGLPHAGGRERGKGRNKLNGVLEWKCRERGD